MSRPLSNVELATSALDFSGWHISERESTTGITVNDTKGRAVARVPLRPDDQDIANATSALPDLLNILDRITRAHETRNNGAVMGEATLCPMFASLARAALNKAKGVR